MWLDLHASHFILNLASNFPRQHFSTPSIDNVRGKPDRVSKPPVIEFLAREISHNYLVVSPIEPAVSISETH
jgi:hypothetical protein